MSMTPAPFAAARVLVVGDVMLDRYWNGATARISPEAPVPVVHIHNASDRPGGAANVALNLAALVADGERIYVPAEDEIVAGSMIDIVQGVGTLVNLNRASTIELETLPGIGPATAAEIVNDRSVNGPFSSVDDLVRVSGVGPATVEKLRDVVSVKVVRPETQRFTARRRRYEQPQSQCRCRPQLR